MKSMNNLKNADMKSLSNSLKILFQNLGIKLQEETPRRFIEMILELTQYQNISNEEIAKLVDTTFDSMKIPIQIIW